MQWSTDMVLKPGDRVWINYLQSIKAIQKFECEGDKYIILHYQFIYLTLRPWNPEHHNLHIIVPSQFIQGDIKINEPGDAVIHLPMVDWQIELMDDDDNRVPFPPNVIQDRSMIINEKLHSWDKGYRMMSTFLCEVVMMNGYILFESKKDLQRRDLVYMKRPTFRVGVVKFYGKPNYFYKDPSSWDDNYIAAEQQIHLRFGEYAALEDPLHKLFPWKQPLLVTQRRHLVGVINPEAEPINIETLINQS
jgi:hypothetical protein